MTNKLIESAKTVAELQQAVEEYELETRSIVALIAEIENLSLPPVSKEKLKFVTDKYKVSDG